MRSDASRPSCPRSEPHASQGRLPFEDATLDAPITYGLTARARRVVASSTLPDLTVLPGVDEERPDPDRFDTRPARARALRRSGRNLPEIAAELEVDEEVAATWTLEVLSTSLESRRSRSKSRAAHDVLAAALEPSAKEADSDLAAAGLVLGLAVVTAHAMTIATPDPAVAGAVARWARTRFGTSVHRIRLTVAVGPAVARDIAAHRWARVAAIPLENVLAAPWPHAPEPTTERATLRIADRRLAAKVASWRTALLAGNALEPDVGEGERSSFASTSLVRPAARA